MDSWVAYALVGLTGSLVGGAELASRYSDEPLKCLTRPAALTYVAVNAAGSLLALYAIRVFGWGFGTKPGDGRMLTQVLIAGAGALTLLRTRLLSASDQAGSSTPGPSRLLEQLLRLSDRQSDRQQASDRTAVVSEVMSRVSFAKAYVILPTYLLGILDNVSKEDQERLADDVKALTDDRTIDDKAKALALGVAVIRLAGPNLLREAVVALGDSIQQS